MPKGTDHFSGREYLGHSEEDEDGRIEHFRAPEGVIESLIPGEEVCGTFSEVRKRPHRSLRGEQGNRKSRPPRKICWPFAGPTKNTRPIGGGGGRAGPLPEVLLRRCCDGYAAREATSPTEFLEHPLDLRQPPYVRAKNLILGLQWRAPSLLPPGLVHPTLGLQTADSSSTFPQPRHIQAQR